MNEIHSTALLGKGVQLGENNQIGPQVVIEDGVTIGSHNRILMGAYICKGTQIGNHNEIHMHSIVGHTPQDIAFKKEPSYTRIGNYNIIREFTTIHRGTKAETSTVIGHHNFIMAYCHIAHNCSLGDEIIMVNQASLTGYCIVEDRAFLSGMTGLHQFTKVGKLSLLSALSAVNKDIPPYMICGGRPAVVLGINVVGLRRASITAPTREEIKQAYKLLYRSGLNVPQALEQMKRQLKSEEVQHLMQFIENSDRGICDGSRSEDGETLKSKK